MPKKERFISNITIADGDQIVYAREDDGRILPIRDESGNEVGRWKFQGTRAHLEGVMPLPPEIIVAGIDLPTRLCQRLVEDGTCARYEAPVSVGVVLSSVPALIIADNAPESIVPDTAPPITKPRGKPSTDAFADAPAA